MLKKIQTLAAARKLDVFEVERLAQDASVSVGTVHTVLKRLPSDWYTVETLSSGERGGQRKRFSLTGKGREAIDRELKRLPRVELGNEDEFSRLSRTSAASAVRLQTARNLASSAPKVAASLERLAYQPSRSSSSVVGHVWGQPQRFFGGGNAVSWYGQSTRFAHENYHAVWHRRDADEYPIVSRDVFDLHTSEPSVVGYAIVSDVQMPQRSRAFAVSALMKRPATQWVAKTVVSFLKVAAHFKHETLEVEEPSPADISVLWRRSQQKALERYSRVFLCCDSQEITQEAEDRLRELLREALGHRMVVVVDSADSQRLESLVRDGQGQYVPKAIDSDPTSWLADAVDEPRTTPASAGWGLPLRLSPT